LDFDGVPWNNNNAEHAIKAFARYRRFADGRFTKKSLSDYLVILGVFQTCEYGGGKVFDFLRSGETSFAFPSMTGLGLGEHEGQCANRTNVQEQIADRR
jgi:hypothetical protein